MGINEKEKVLTDEEIVKEIYKIGENCLKKNIDHIIISGIIPRIDPIIDARRKNVNTLLKNMCAENGFTFQDNSNIRYNQLWKDGLHFSYFRYFSYFRKQHDQDSKSIEPMTNGKWRKSKR